MGIYGYLRVLIGVILFSVHYFLPYIYSISYFPSISVFSPYLRRHWSSLRSVVLWAAQTRRTTPRYSIVPLSTLTLSRAPSDFLPASPFLLARSIAIILSRSPCSSALDSPTVGAAVPQTLSGIKLPCSSHGVPPHPFLSLRRLIPTSPSAAPRIRKAHSLDLPSTILFVRNPDADRPPPPRPCRRQTCPSAPLELAGSNNSPKTTRGTIETT
jgi:hypothetical protein